MFYLIHKYDILCAISPCFTWNEWEYHYLEFNKFFESVFRIDIHWTGKFKQIHGFYFSYSSWRLLKMSFYYALIQVMIANCENSVNTQYIAQWLSYWLSAFIAPQSFQAQMLCSNCTCSLNIFVTNACVFSYKQMPSRPSSVPNCI